MKIGFNMLLWTTNLVEDQFDLLEKIKKVGYDGVEIPIFGGEEKVEHFKNIGKVLKNNGLECTSVTVIPDEDRSPISENSSSIKHIIADTQVENKSIGFFIFQLLWLFLRYLLILIA